MPTLTVVSTVVLLYVTLGNVTHSLLCSTFPAGSLYFLSHFSTGYDFYCKLGTTDTEFIRSSDFRKSRTWPCVLQLEKCLLTWFRLKCCGRMSLFSSSLQLSLSLQKLFLLSITLLVCLPSPGDVLKWCICLTFTRSTDSSCCDPGMLF